jgi:molecular chaperone GrpE (heat shock protein)
MTKFYKGQRISELLESIDKLSRALEDNHDAYENETQALRAIEARTTLAIAKAKLTALQGEA